MSEDLQILLEPIEEPQLSTKRLREIALDHPDVRNLVGPADPRRLIVSDPEVLGRKPEPTSPFRATVFHPDSNRAVELSGTLDAPEDLRVRPVSFTPVPQAAELREAADILRGDGRFAARLARPDVTLYQPMPPLADVERGDGTVARRPTIGIFDPSGSPRHQIVAVDTAAGNVDAQPEGVDAATDDDCEEHLPVGVDSLADAGGPKQVRVRVIKGGQEIWNLIVRRPRDSAPQTFGKGSGVELRMVTHRGPLVLWQAHVPILNVLYDDGVSYRDWQNQETPFAAEGNDPVGPGWRLCTQPPATILESGTDAGNFQGVALWYADGELRIVSEVQAGWYRYVSDWRLRDDGVIKPRFGFAGTRNPRTCMRHQHHVYWRLDFDIEGAGADIVEQQGLFFPGRPRWTTIVRETSRKRSAMARTWRVLDKSTQRGYRIVPGPVDGTADAYGGADLWFLRYHADELEDGVSLVGGTAADTQIKTNKFLNGESIEATDIVVWYAGHFVHDEHDPSPHQGHIVGPELRPLNWT
jgi:hypothetical protein